MGCSFTCFFLTTNTSAHTLILPRHTHTALSSQENPQSAAAALQKLINLPMRGISSLGSHYKAGERWVGEMGTGSSMAALGSWGKPRSLPCRTLCALLMNVLLIPLCLLQPPRATLVQQKAPRPALLIYDGFPLNSQPCSAYGIQLRGTKGADFT